ncbi:MAG: NCS2 family nucleobase:cation symporter [Propionibacteriaceae bacterium]|nr:NCS2 family nucleobase:cation symporter [Propionibacteriaceae bacterium]
MAIWKLHGDGRRIAAGEVVKPDERLIWPFTIGMGMQHVVAMFGATFLVPLLTGFPPATTLFFSAIGTMLFLLITGNRLPSYLGSSFAFIAPIAAATASDGGNMGTALFGVLAAGILLAAVGALVHFVGPGWIEKMMPPVVTGAIVMLIGFNLAPSAWNNVSSAKTTAFITIAAVLLVTVLFKGMIGRLSILIGVVVGYIAAAIQDAAGVLVQVGTNADGSAIMGKQLDFSLVTSPETPWIGFPTFMSPQVDWTVLGLFLPVVLVLMAENIGHIKSVSLMTGKDYNATTGRALLADGVATVLAGFGGGSGTTTYAENIGVMAATKIYSTAVYWVAGGTALVLSMCPKFGALIATIPVGVLGGAGTVLYGMIGLLGARIWVENKVDFGTPVNLMTAAVALIMGIANYTVMFGKASFSGIAMGAIGAIVIYQVMRVIAKWRGTGLEPASPASAPGA